VLESLPYSSAPKSVIAIRGRSNYSAKQLSVLRKN